MKNELIQNKKVLVTGGAGLIGANLCEALLKLNYKVVCLDNFSTGKMENIEHFLKNQNFKLVGGDVRNIKVCIRECKDVDYVLHYAVLRQESKDKHDLLTINEVNVTGFLNLLAAANKANVKGIVYNTKTNFNNALPNLLSPYSVAKETTKLYANFFTNTYNLPITELNYQHNFEPETIAETKKEIKSRSYINTIVQLNLEALSKNYLKELNLV